MPLSDMKRDIHTRSSKNTAELKMFYEEEWSRISSVCLGVIQSYRKNSFQYMFACLMGVFNKDMTAHDCLYFIILEIC